MSNQTIYPFGPGATLPAGYSIADDLKTDNAQRPLSARQGTIIRPYIMDDYNKANLAQITESNYSLGNNNNWYQAGKHKVVPVTPGDKIRLTVQGIEGSDGGFWAFFTSAYTVPTSTSQAPPYVSGSRNWLDTGSTLLEVPTNAAYVCICTKDGAGNKTWQVATLIAKSTLIPRSEIVDGLTSDATDVPLSARQGKVLGEAVFASNIPSGLTKYDYNGVLVETKKKTHKVARQNVSKISSISCQGGDCFGDYLFMFTENNTTCWIFNLATQTAVQTITIPADQRGFVSNCHCNTVNFGTEYYDANDPFPLIYVSTGYNDGATSGVLVYRIVATTESDVTTYSLVLVQTIKIPGTSWTEFIVGDDNCCYIKYEGGTCLRYYKMTMPKLSDGDITLDLSTALELLDFSKQAFSSPNQQHIYFNGKLYVISGAAGAGLFFVLDLATRTREALVDLNSIGLTSEPEACFFWDNKLCIAFRSNANIQALYFE